MEAAAANDAATAMLEQRAHAGWGFGSPATGGHRIHISVGRAAGSRPMDLLRHRVQVECRGACCIINMRAGGKNYEAIKLFNQQAKLELAGSLI